MSAAEDNAIATDVVRQQIDRAVMAALVEAVESWGAPLVNILETEGHDHECDAVLSNNLTLCDCWWGRLKTACDGLLMVQEIARAALAEPPNTPAPTGEADRG